MVVTFAPSTCAAGTRHELTGAPSISTVHAPHSPSPQPSFVPVSRQCSRRTSRSRLSGCTSSRVCLPFSVRRMSRTDRKERGRRRACLSLRSQRAVRLNGFGGHDSLGGRRNLSQVESGVPQGV